MRLHSPSEVRLETPRLLLREYEPDDWRAVMTYAADPEVLRYRLSEPATEAEVKAGLARIEGHRLTGARTRYELAVVRKDTGELIGWLPLFLGAPETQDAEVGWTLARAHWGLGFATEAAFAAFAFAFETLELHRLWARCVPENVASWRVMEKLGMRREGHFREMLYVKGSWEDAYYYGMLSREWWQRRREEVQIEQ